MEAGSLSRKLDNCAGATILALLIPSAARVRVLAPFAHLDIPAIGQTYLLFRAALAAPFTFSAGPESQEVGLFGLDELPWNDIAFSSTSVALKARGSG